MKRVMFAVLLVTAGAALVLAAGQAEAAAPDVIVNPPGTYPIVDETMTIDVWTTYGAAAHDGNYEGAAFTQWFEDLTNVRMNFVEIAEMNVAQERLNLVLASGDLPDTFMNQQLFNPQQVYTNGLFGNFIPVDDLIENWMPALSQTLVENPGYAGSSSCPTATGTRFQLSKATAITAP